jgi:hypothetical protein
MSRPRCATLACLLVLTSTGCADGKGSTDSGADAGPAQIRAAVERVWNDVYDASRAGDGRRLCRHMTAQYARRLIADVEARTCAEAARYTARVVNDAVPADAKPRYSSFATHGGRARIHVTLAAREGPLRNTVRFRLVEREWKVDGDSGTDAA